MKRLSPLMTLVVGLVVGLAIGAGITVARAEVAKINYDQIIGAAGETKITRGKLAEACIARFGSTVAPELQEQAVVDEALRLAGVSATEAEITTRIDDLKRYAADNELAKKMIEAYPPNVLRDKFRTVLSLEKAMNVTVSDAEAREFYQTYPNIFFSKAQAKLICIATEKKADAISAMRRLKDGEDPNKLAVLLSTNEKIRATRGDTGYQTRERVNNPELVAAIFEANEGRGMKSGQYTEPIAITMERVVDRADGTRATERYTEYWVVFVADFRPAKAPQFEDVKAQAALLARGAKLQVMMRKWVNDQQQKIPVKWVKSYDDLSAEMVVVPPSPPPLPQRN